MFYRYTYFPAPPSQPFQGTQAQLNKKLKATGLHILSGGNGSWRIGGYSSGLIHEYADEKATKPIRSITPDKVKIRTLYNKTNVTEKDFIRLTADLNSGTISIYMID